MNSALRLVFHSVKHRGEKGYDHPLTCPIERLIAILEFLSHEGYRTVPCSYWNSTDASRTKESVASLCFDDGYVDAFRTVLPTLLQYRATGTFAIVTCVLEEILPPNMVLNLALERLGTTLTLELIRASLVGTTYGELLSEAYTPTGHPFLSSKGEKKRLQTLVACHLPLELRNMLSTQLLTEIQDCDKGFFLEHALGEYVDIDMVRTMSDRGMEIATHTHTHPMLHNCSSDEIVTEYDQSVRIIESITGKKVGTMVWPYGNKETPAHLVQTARRYDMAHLNYVNSSGSFETWRGITPTVGLPQLDHRLLESTLGIPCLDQ